MAVRGALILRSKFLLMTVVAVYLTGCHANSAIAQVQPVRLPAVERMVGSAMAQTGYTRFYNPAYVRIDYPNGDVPRETGVCSDVIIRAFRSAGVDLQKLVHEDMAAHFGAYPKLWGLRRPDRNIDHRRVANLMRFFERKRKNRAVSAQGKDYRPGDVVAWRLPNGRLHIGVVSDRPVSDKGRCLVVHNIGAGARSEDLLFTWPVIGHYRYF